jgi:CheY-like chemotaxis protein
MTDAEAVVCIIDDEEAVRIALTDLLESVGLRVQAYVSGREFLQTLRADSPPSCLILDIRLPGSSGLEFQQQLIAGNIDQVEQVVGELPALRFDRSRIGRRRGRYDSGRCGHESPARAEYVRRCAQHRS